MLHLLLVPFMSFHLVNPFAQVKQRTVEVSPKPSQVELQQIFGRQA